MDGEVPEKSLKIRWFPISFAMQNAGMPILGLPEERGMRDLKSPAPVNAVGCLFACSLEASNGNPGSHLTCTMGGEAMGNREGDYTRREFMTKPLTYLASASLIGLSGEGLLRAADSASASKMIVRPLGKTGISLPIVSMGVMNAEAPGVILRAWEAGIRYFDTAPIYLGGRSEEMLGQVIRQLGVRDKVVIATKATVRGTGKRAPEETKADALASLDASLTRLQMDHVEVFLLHEVNSARSVADAGIQAAMMQLKKEGKIRWAGVSTHQNQADVLNAAMSGGLWDVVLVGFNYTMADNQAMLDAMKACASKGIGIVAMKTQAGGSNPSRQEVLGSDITAFGPPVGGAQVGSPAPVRYHGDTGRYPV